MLSYHVLNDSMVISSKGQFYHINKSDARYDAILPLIKAGRLDEIEQHLQLKIRHQDMQIKDNLVYVDNEPVSDYLSDKIIQFQKENIPFEYLIKFIRKLRKNPSYNSRLMLYKFLEHNGHPITTEGNFIAYRGVTTDFKDVHTKTFDNSPGSICEIPRDKVDDNPNNTCSYGLHVACYSYAKSFGSVLVEVEVDPADVVCVPVDYNGTKMRVCKFKVVQKVVEMNNNYVVTSSYEQEMLTEEEKDESVFIPLEFKNPSSFIEKAWLDTDNNVLGVLIKGKTYEYAIPAYTVLVAWENSASPGLYFNQHIKV